MFKFCWSIARYQLCSGLYAHEKDDTGNNPITSSFAISNCEQHPFKIAITDVRHSSNSIVQRSSCLSSCTVRLRRFLIAHVLRSTRDGITETGKGEAEIQYDFNSGHRTTTVSQTIPPRTRTAAPAGVKENFQIACIFFSKYSTLETIPVACHAKSIHPGVDARLKRREKRVRTLQTYHEKKAICIRLTIASADPRPRADSAEHERA